MVKAAFGKQTNQEAGVHSGWVNDDRSPVVTPEMRSHWEWLGGAPLTAGAT